MVVIIMVKSSTTLFFIITTAVKWETKTQAAIRENMKGVFLSNGNIHCTERTKTDGREGDMRVWGGAKKRTEEKKRERGRQSGSRIDRFAPSPTPSLTLCLEALKHKSLWERELKGSVLIKYSFSVKLAWHHCQPLTTGPSLHSLAPSARTHTKSNRQKNTHSNVKTFIQRQ